MLFVDIFPKGINIFSVCQTVVMLNALNPCLIMSTTESTGSVQQMAAEHERPEKSSLELCFYVICLQLALENPIHHFDTKGAKPPAAQHPSRGPAFLRHGLGA